MVESLKRCGIWFGFFFNLLLVFCKMVLSTVIYNKQSLKVSVTHKFTTVFKGYSVFYALRNLFENQNF